MLQFNRLNCNYCLCNYGTAWFDKNINIAVSNAHAHLDNHVLKMEESFSEEEPTTSTSTSRVKNSYSTIINVRTLLC